jgi:hypothetical protein
MSTEREVALCYQALDFARGVLLPAVDKSVAFRVIMEIEIAFFALGLSKEQLRARMEEKDNATPT